MKEWLVMVHNLAGAPVAAACMVAPLKPAAGSAVLHNAWQIWQPEVPGSPAWRLWGRLQTWRERGNPPSVMGYALEILASEPPLSLAGHLGCGKHAEELVVETSRSTAGSAAGGGGPATTAAAATGI
eukprot:SM006395S19832  [mRNA]  locus=s6395:167:780:+ [translate_table: standard]